MSGDGDSCPFCTLDTERVLEFNEHAHAFRDGYPVTELHTLVTPKRHVATYFELSEDERKGMHALLESQRAKIMAEDDTVEGFNIGWNCGEVAGQTTPMGL